MVAPGSYVSLHNHTEHSTLDGLSRLNELCEAAAADGSPAVGITDHGTMSGTFKFAAAARKAGIKPLMGFEAYLAIGSRHDQNSIEVPRDDAESDADDDGTGKGSTKVKRYEHLTLLASDTDGWANLCKLTSYSHDSFWYKPRIDFELMAEHNRGIIALTGCLGGPVAGRLLRGDTDGAYQAAADLVEMYGRTNVFAEVMDHGIAVERVLMPQLVELAKHFGIRTVATNDTHFVSEGDAHAHDAWLCVAQNKKVADGERWRFNGAGYHMRTAAEMRALFDDQNGTSEAVDSTLLIAERCADNILPESRLRLPKYTSPEMGDRDSDKYLYDLVVEGARARFGTLTDKIKARLRFEFDMISSKGLSDYFLIQWDIICEARRRGIRVGPGRGSAAGCLISYCLTIVNVDPLENDLLFERFLNPDRVSMPDIDTDYDSAGRDEMIRYTAERFGLDFVARIGTFGQALSRRSIRDAARVLDLAPIGDELARLVPIGANGKPASIESMIAATQGTAVVAAADGDDAWGETSAGSNSGSTRDGSVNAAARDFMAAAQASELHRQVFELAAAFENRINQEGIHACGVVVADEPLYGMVPLRTDHKKGPNQGQLVTQWDGKDIDTFGLLKMDFLALLNLDIITACEKFIRARSGEEVDGDNPPIFPAGTGATALTRRGERFTALEQERVERTWALIRSGRTSGVFQLESRGMTELCTKVEASSLAELSAIIALFRPGPLAANMHVHYADRKHGVEEIDYGIFTKGSPNEAAEQAAIATVLGDSLGVCLTGDTRVYSLSRGHLIDLDDVRVGETVQGVNDDLLPAPGRVAKVVNQGARPVREVEFISGASLRATDEHPFLTPRGWVPASDLRPGDVVAAPKSYLPPRQPVTGPTTVEAKVLGYLLGDGSLSAAHNVAFVNSDTALLDAYRTAVDSVFGPQHYTPTPRARGVTTLNTSSGSGGGSTPGPVLTWLRSLGLKAPATRWRDGGPTSAEKFVPERFLSANEDVVAALLAALWDCDGSVSRPGTSLSFSYKTISRQLAEDVQFLLLRLGIRSQLCASPYVTDAGGQEVAFQITTGDSVGFRQIAMLMSSAHKRDRALNGRGRRYSSHSAIPSDIVVRAIEAAGCRVRPFCESVGISRSSIRRSGARNVGSSVVAKVAEHTGDAGLVRLLNTNWERVTSNTVTGRSEVVYDIEVDGIHNFVANGVVVHNCIFQESMMRLGSVVAGFGPSERNRLQKAVSKKIKEEVDAVGEMFFAGGVSDAAMDGTPKLAFAETTVSRVWDAIKGAAAYAFNASHSYAYAWLAYCTAYLKANWTAEYGAALLSVTEKAERRQMVLAALRKDGVTVLGPSVNESRFTTSVDESGAVRIGLSEIKDVGSDIVHLIDERDANGPFTSLSDVAVRVKWTPDGETKPKSIPSDKLVALIEAGAFDDFGPRLGQAMIAKAVSKAPSIAVIDAEWPQLERAARERDRLKVLLSPHPLATMHDLRSWRSRAGERPCSVANIPTNDGDRCLVLGMIASWEERAYSGGRMARFTLEGSTGSLEGVVWAGTVRKLAELGTTPKPGVIAAVQGRVAIRELRTHDDGGAESDTGQAAEETIELLGNDVFLVNVDDPMRLDLEPGPVLDLSVDVFDLQLVTAPSAPGTPEPCRALSDPVGETSASAEPEPEVAGPQAGVAAPPEPPIERPMSAPRARPVDPALAERTAMAPAPSQVTNDVPDTPTAVSTVPVSLPGVVTELERGLSTLSPVHGALIGGHLYLAVTKGAGVITPRSVRILLDTHFPGLWGLIAERLRDSPPRRGTMVALPTRPTWTTPVWAIQACDRPVVELVQEMTDAGAHTDALSELHSH